MDARPLPMGSDVTVVSRIGMKLPCNECCCPGHHEAAAMLMMTEGITTFLMTAAIEADVARLLSICTTS